MTPRTHHLTLSACALAATLFLAACGGGGSSDTVPPTVSITSAAGAGGAVTFTFTFSEPLYSGTFTAEDIVVTGGTVGAFTMTDSTHATLSVTPTTGTLSVSVAANKFDDLAHNFNQVSASNTYIAPTLTFDGTVAFDAFEGLIGATVENDPVAGASNKVAKLVKGPTGQPWAGATVYTSGSLSTPTVSAIDLANNKVVTIRSYTTAAIGTKMTIKFENAADAGQNIAAETVTTKQGQWETLTFNFASPSTGVFNPAATYNKVSIFPAFSIPAANPVAPAANTDFYFDDLTYAAVSSGGSGSGGSGSGGTVTAPTTAAPTPTAAAANVMSLFGSAYTGVPVDTFLTGWSDATLTDVTVGGKAVKKYSALNFAGIETVAHELDVSSYDYVSFDAWSPDFVNLALKLVDFGANGAYDGGGDDSSGIFHVTPLTQGVWNTYKIPLSSFTGLAAKAHIAQLLFATNDPVGGTGPVGAATVYIDNLYFGKNAASGGGSSGATTTFMSGFMQATTVEGGKYGGYSGSSLDNWNCPGSSGTTTNCGAGGSFTDGSTPAATAADSSFYYYYQFTGAAPTGEYVGIYAQAPGVTALSSTGDTAGVSAAGKTNINFNLTQNAEWNGGAEKNFAVMLTLGKYYNVGSSGAPAACNFKLLTVVTPTAISANYSIPLSAFSVTQNCGVTLADAAAALAAAPVSQIDFQGDSGGSALTAGGKTTGANTLVANGSYKPTTIALKGGITFN